MKKHIVTAVLYTVVTAVLLGIVYPLAVTGMAHVLFPRQADGQLIKREWCAGGVASDRTGVQRAGILLVAAVGSGDGIRCGKLFGLQPGADEQGPGNAREGIGGRRWIRRAGTVQCRSIW